MTSLTEQTPDYSDEPAWSQDQGVSFEAAQELLNRVHGHLLHRSLNPDLTADEATAIEAQITDIQDRIRSLDPLDQTGVAAIREHYGPVVRSYEDKKETDGTS